MQDKSCPCGSELLFKQCCQPLLHGRSYAKTAEQLMRSRYSAFVVKDCDYIARTCWPRLIDKAQLKMLEQSVHSTQWHGLKVLGFSKGGPRHEDGKVEFHAIYTTADAPASPQLLQEKSSFIKLAGRWYYTEGDVRTSTTR